MPFKNLEERHGMDRQPYNNYGWAKTNLVIRHQHKFLFYPIPHCVSNTLNDTGGWASKAAYVKPTLKF